MRNLNFRTLTAEDVECRVCNATEKMINLLIYKNARVDMAILNDTVGMGWKREHNFKDGINYCTVSIYDEENKVWVSREDCGVESNTEAEKGQSSDAFKRACFNWGIGTELYTGPRISIQKTDKDMFNGKLTMTFAVSELEVSDDHKITHIVIVDKWNNERYRWDKGQKQAHTATPKAKTTEETIAEMKVYCRAKYKEFNDSDRPMDAERVKEFVEFYERKLTSGEWTGEFRTEQLLNSWINKRR